MLDLQDDKITIPTQKGLSEVFGVSERTIRKWIKSGAPGKKDGNYDITAIAKWRGISLDDEPEGNEDDKQGKAYWETQFRKWRAKLSKILYEKEHGLLMLIEEVEKRETAIVQIFTHALTLQQDRFPPKLEGKTRSEMSIIIHEENNYVRKQIGENHS